MNRAKPLSLRKPIWIFAFALSLLFSQFVGQYHRIEHTRWQDDADAQLQTQKVGDKNHSCFLFDALTIADAVGTALAMALLVASTHMLAHQLACLLWDAPVVHHFLSRAPPRN